MEGIGARQAFLIVVFFTLLSMTTIGALDQAQTVSAQPPRCRDVCINEVEMDPRGADTGRQWMEFYNPKDTTADIGGWIIRTGRPTTIRIPPGTAVPPKGVLVITLSGTPLRKAGETLTLLDPGDTIKDQVPAGTIKPEGMISDTFDDERTWQRVPNGWDTDTLGDWKFQTQSLGEKNKGKFPSRLTLRASATTVKVDETVTVYGSLETLYYPDFRPEVTLTIERPDGSRLTERRAVTNALFDFTMRLDQVGVYRFTAAWGGDEFHEPAPAVSTTVSAERLTLSSSIRILAIVPGNVSINGTVKVIGFLNLERALVPTATVTLTYRFPNGTVAATRSLQVSVTNGTFIDDFSFTVTNGTWTVTASYGGDAGAKLVYPAASHSASFFVYKPAPPPTPPKPLTRPPVATILILLAAVATIAIAVGAGALRLGPARLPIARIRALRPARRTLSMYRPLRIRGAALCPRDLTPMQYQPQRREWYCPLCKTFFRE